MDKSRKFCSLCNRPKTGLWFLTEDCSVCRAQWRAFYAGQTPVSPLMRAITVDQVERNSKTQIVG